MLPIKKKSKKITKMKRFPLFNIGTLMFGIVFVYMIICMVMYLTSTHVTAYEVTAGPLSGNYRFSALALKAERIVTAEQAGNINYYAREGSKVGAGNSVYSIGGAIQTTTPATTLATTESAQQSEAATTADGQTESSSGTETSEAAPAPAETESVDYLDSKSLSKVRSNMANFSTGFDEMSFQNVYNFKADTESTVLELANEKALSDLENSNGQLSVLGSLYQAPQEGIVVYAVDGYENLTAEDIKPESFDQKNYHKQNLRLNKSVKTGDAVYKLVTDENWSLIIPLDKKLLTELSDNTTVRFRFLKDGTAFNADFSILQNGDNSYGKLDISNSVIRYAGERFVDIELVLNRETGLKIPKSAIAEKQFFKIPKEFVTENEENDNEVSILKESVGKDGKTVTKYITATVYEKTDKEYYVGTTLFKVGDYILKKDSSKKYQVSGTGSLQGVYNINKGYAVFREIKIIDENEEYCIVEAGSSYGLSQYDRIVLNADTVNDEDIVY
ncbi:HlyD family efflux transporter periplasmic adaptor subunit [uncultured Robinsoniella sp.]|uniref:HlyD family efflux transporter periplasmic adaptor subunit n=1 Tax=Robinsoniella sp. TaxID=2496533 RepID=UPI00374F21CD